jgi:DUF4097 and DUF4098 domain-containing protein YvlB
MLRDHAVRTAVTAVALLGLGAGTLRAQRTIDTTLAVRANARLSLSNQSGDIVIRSWNRSQIRVQAESDRARVEINESPSGVSVRTVNRGGHGDVDYTITVPNGTALELHAMSSDMEISGVCGQLDINAMSGGVTADCVEGSAQIETISGDITLTNARGTVDLSTTSGDVELRTVRGRVSVESVSGDVSLDQIESNDITAEVVSGDVEYTGRIVDGGRYRFSAHSGDVTVRVPGTPNATIGIETFSGDFESDFQIQLAQNTQINGKNWEFRLGTGSARVQLNSFSGTISLRRLGAGGPREE